MNGWGLALLVAGAGAFGALGRVLFDDAGLALARRREGVRGLGAWPWALLLINVLGSFVLGLLTGALPSGSIWLVVLGAGWCGGFTTFSTWAVLIGADLLARRWRRAAFTVAAHLVLGLVAAALGLALARGWS